MDRILIWFRVTLVLFFISICLLAIGLITDQWEVKLVATVPLIVSSISLSLYLCVKTVQAYDVKRGLNKECDFNDGNSL